MNNFHNVTFPLALSQGASGGPKRETAITTLASGAEHRNNRHAGSRRRYDIGAGIESLGDVRGLVAFFEARRGQLYAFRFRDPLDFDAVDEAIGIGDGTATEFQLTKTYSDAAGSWTRSITKPRSETLVVKTDGQTVSVSVDDLTGIITFASPPSMGATITASFEFDVPVRFADDHLDLSLESYRAGKPARISLVEVRHA